MATVRIGQRLLDDMFAHARDSSPRECCGLLIGIEREILETVRARNLAESPSEFLLDPRDHINARRDAREQRLEVVGFYHSHPHSRPIPSAKDVDEASYPDCIYLIVGMDDGREAARAFRLVGTAFEEVDLRVTAARAGLHLNGD